VVGRDADLAAVEQLLTDYRCVTVSGPGGAGKSTLALTVAHRLDDRGGEVLVAELAPARDAAAVLRTVAETAGVEGSAARDVTALAAVLGRRRVTLVLDNCEHLLDACAELADALLEAGPAVRLLATSREPLGIDGEAVRRLGSLGDSAAELFVASSCAARHAHRPRPRGRRPGGPGRRSAGVVLRPGPRRWPCSRTPPALRRRGPWTGAGPRCRPAPSAARRGRSWPVAAPLRWCPDATRARTRCTGSGARGAAAWWGATRTARATVPWSRCLAGRPGSRTAGTSHPARPPGRRARRDRARAAGP
jgi:hypothetical protein